MATVRYANTLPAGWDWSAWAADSWSAGISPVVVFDPSLGGFVIRPTQDAQLAVLTAGPGTGGVVRLMGPDLSITGNFGSDNPVPLTGTITGFRLYDRYEHLLTFDDPNNRILNQNGVLWDGVLMVEASGLSIDASALQSAANPAAALAAQLTAGNDSVTGSIGADLIRGGAGADTLIGSAGDDTLEGEDGNDTLIGGAGNDVLRHGPGDDLAQGGPGDDVFASGGGSDTFDGGTGNDTVVQDLTGFAAGAFTVQTNLVAGTNSAVGSVQGSDTLISIENIEMRGAIDAILTGTAGANRLLSGSGNDRLAGDGGNDTLHGGDGADTLNGGDGDDVIRGGDTAADLRDVIFGGLGNDRIDAGHGNDQVYGGDGDDTVEGGFGVDEIIGQGGNDVLTGSAFSDLIFGGDGDDFINGGFGSDRVNGGAGADRFYHLGIADHGSDWIQDYSAAEGDVLVWGGGAATRAQFQVNTTQTAGAGAAGVDEAFVIYRPTGQILWALVDGGAQGAINIQIGGQAFDLLA
jgi:Ca2+-binding RTX toxin-like protein